MVIFLAANTVLEFVFIMIGMIIVLALAITLVDSLNKKGKDFKDKQRINKAEIFINRDIATIDDLLRFSSGSPGETSRVLTKSYYTLFFEENIKSSKNLENLLHHRNNALHLQGAGLKETFIAELSKKYANNLTTALFALVIYENSIHPSQHINKTTLPIIFKIITEEHNKLAPRDHKSTIDFSPATYFTIVSLFEKYDIQVN